MERIRGQRECSWSNSDSSSVGSDEEFTSPYSNQPAPDARMRALRIPIVHPNLSNLPSRREYWQQCLVVVLKDFRKFSSHTLQRHVDREWRLRGRATVLGREGNNYLIELTEDIDRNYAVVATFTTRCETTVWILTASETLAAHSPRLKLPPPLGPPFLAASKLCSITDGAQKLQIASLLCPEFESSVVSFKSRRKTFQSRPCQCKAQPLRSRFPANRFPPSFVICMLCEGLCAFALPNPSCLCMSHGLVDTSGAYEAILSPIIDLAKTKIPQAPVSLLYACCHDLLKQFSYPVCSFLAAFCCLAFFPAYFPVLCVICLELDMSPINGAHVLSLGIYLFHFVASSLLYKDPSFKKRPEDVDALVLYLLNMPMKCKTKLNMDMVQKRVSTAVQESPWLLDGGMLVVEPWRPNTALRDVEVRHTNMWVQLWGMPLEYFQEEIAVSLAQVIGPVERVDWDNTNIRFMRVEVLVDLTRPLIPDCSMVRDDGVRERVRFRYERVEKFCAGNENFGQQTDQQHQQQQGGEQLQNLEGTDINLPPLPEILLNLPQVEYEENRVTVEAFHQSEGSQQEEPQLLPEESQEAHINQGKGLAETVFEIWQEQQSKIDEMFNEMNKQGGRYLDDLLQRVYGSPYTQLADNTPRWVQLPSGNLLYTNGRITSNNNQERLESSAMGARRMGRTTHNRRIPSFGLEATISEEEHLEMMYNFTVQANPEPMLKTIPEALIELKLCMFL
ncbi:hypothetical protein CCACVL1_09301 [Corchorus capsularis]|uniref:Uncharacterized protein n=1 Tax=Corchorus capsularis TaxID=210143 RepID=A0A1R3IWT9_COCAP|nr:hypothetical protein CCACVL1_09301 [Corchorus capsularis]